MGHNGDTQVATHDFKKVLEHLGRGANARTVYGEPTVIGEHAVIPVARVRYMGGGGLGSAMTHAERSEELGRMESEPSGEGMGVGFNVSARPVGTIDVTASGVKWSPTMDWGRLANTVTSVIGVLTIMWAARRLFRAA